MKDEYEERDRQRGRAEFFTAADADTDIISMMCDPQTGESRPVKAITPGRANRLLRERSTVVYGDIKSLAKSWYLDNNFISTHQALLICIEPKEKPDTAEQIAHDLANYKFDHEVGLRFREFVDRARRLLKEEK